MDPEFVIPAQAGIHFASVKSQWVPAFAGTTTLEMIGDWRIGATAFANGIYSRLATE